MINFSKCSLNGCSFKLLYDQQSSILEDQISYLAVNFFNSDSYWVPYKTNYPSLSDISMKLGYL
jgi:hypothetical protein